jgi:DNA polymerase elongation subunit (family B)
MFINCYYDHKRSTMHLWEQIKGEKFYDKINWVPYVYEPVDTVDDAIHSIDGKAVSKKTFNTYHEYYETTKDSHKYYENRCKPEIQFLTERYYAIPDDELEVPKLRTFTLDIEVLSRNGFPSYKDANDEITLISIRDSITKHTTSWGCKPYTDTQPNATFVYCKNEGELLIRFFLFLSKNPYDVLSGWNIWGFDLPYIIFRTKRLFGEDCEHYFRFSPIHVVRTWEEKNGSGLNIDIAGVHILDYLDVYKWYTPSRPERYTLDFISNLELEKGKVDYSEYKDLNELYDNDWNKYVYYNMVDVRRVDQLEDKLGYIRLIQALSLLTKCPMKYYQSMSQLIEGAFLTHYRRTGQCAPIFMGGEQVGFPAAYVKEPQAGMHNWIIDIDITSSYPSHMITLNMSGETYFGRIQEFNDEQMVHYVRQKEFPLFNLWKGENKYITFTGESLDKFNSALKKGLFTIAPCGSVFTNRKVGELAKVEKAIFFKRVEVKNKMKDVKTRAKESKDPAEASRLNERGTELFSLQWALKILLNAVFGIMAVPYSRYFNVNIAEAITSCGRHTIKEGEKFINEYFNKHLGYPGDFIAYIDTDSLFIKVGDYLRNAVPEWKTWGDEQKVPRILEFARELEEYVNKRIYEETQLIDYNSPVTDFKIGFKQEIVAKTALFVKKKKYAYWCINKEGLPEDKLSVTGLEIVRGDSAEAIRTRLKHVYELIMKGAADDEIISTITKYKNELKKVSPESIASNIGVNGLRKYIKSDGPIKGTPWHVKGAYNYHLLLKELGLGEKYERITEGSKSKVLYIKTNRYNVEVLTFLRWPKEFDLHLMVDYDMMIDKFFLNKISFLLEPMGKADLLVAGESNRILNAFFD